jgi:hypothetical protein
MKYCAPCREDRPISEFNKHKKTYDGLTGVCKTCYQKRYGRKSIPQRDLPASVKDPLDRKFSRHSNAIKFLEKMLLIYGYETYVVDKTIKMIAEDLDMPERTTYRYLYILKDMGLLRRTYCDNKDRSKGYKWWITINKPS